MIVKLKVAEAPQMQLKVSECINEGGKIYDGEYEVAPRPFEAVVLETEGKRMNDNVKVLEIPYSQVDNESGGHTVTIGGAELWNRTQTR